MSQQQLINIIAMVAIFGLVFSVWCICVFLWFGQYLSRLQSVQKRLGIVKKDTDESKTLRLWRERQREITGDSVLEKLTLQERMERLRDAAGWHAPAQMVILGVVGTAMLSFVVTYLLGGGPMLGLGISVAIVVVFWSYTKSCISKREALFERQLLDGLGIAARALRAGHPLLGAFQLISEEIDEPIGDIFFRICHEQLLGLDLAESILKVARTTYNPELKLFATAVSIQLRSGGNLADLMDSLANVIRARMRLNRRVRVLTSATNLSKRILIALPILLFFWLSISSPKYMELFYTTTAGKFMIMVMVVMILLGAWVMNRIAVLRF
ncbi:MAG: type II secretion system F family protein [Sedimentisphaerales bacterium]